MICFCGTGTNKVCRRKFAKGQVGNIFLCEECKDLTRHEEEAQFRRL